MQGKYEYASVISLCLHRSFLICRMENASLSHVEPSSSTIVEKIRKEWQSTLTNGGVKPVNKSQTLADQVTFERHTRMGRPDANLAGQSDERVIHSCDKKASDKAVSVGASEITSSLQSFDDDGDDAPLDDPYPDEPPYQAPGETQDICFP